MSNLRGKEINRKQFIETAAPTTVNRRELDLSWPSVAKVAHVRLVTPKTWVYVPSCTYPKRVGSITQQAAKETSLNAGRGITLLTCVETQSVECSCDYRVSSFERIPISRRFSLESSKG